MLHPPKMMRSIKWHVLLFLGILLFFNSRLFSSYSVRIVRFILILVSFLLYEYWVYGFGIFGVICFVIGVISAHDFTGVNAVLTIDAGLEAVIIFVDVLCEMTFMSTG